MAVKTPTNPAIAVSRVELKRADLVSLVESDGLLRNCALIRALGPEGVREAMSVGVGRRFRDGQQVFEQGDAGDSVFLVIRGEVRLIAKGRGESVEAGVARKGDVFGEASLLDGVDFRGGAAVAAGELEVIELPRAALFDAEHARPELRLYLEEIRARRQSASDEMADFLKRW